MFTRRLIKAAYTKNIINNRMFFVRRFSSKDSNTGGVFQSFKARLNSYDNIFISKRNFKLTSLFVALAGVLVSYKTFSFHVKDSRLREIEKELDSVDFESEKLLEKYLGKPLLIGEFHVHNHDNQVELKLDLRKCEEFSTKIGAIENSLNSIWTTINPGIFIKKRDMYAREKLVSELIFLLQKIIKTVEHFHNNDNTLAVETIDNLIDKYSSSNEKNLERVKNNKKMELHIESNIYNLAGILHISMDEVIRSRAKKRQNASSPVQNTDLAQQELNDHMDAAINCFGKAIKTNKSEKIHVFYSNRAWAYIYKKEFEKAWEDQKKAYDARPNDPNILHGMGVAFYYKLDPRKAYQHYTKSIEICGACSYSLFQRGMLLTNIVNIMYSKLDNDVVKQMAYHAIDDFSLFYESNQVVGTELTARIYCSLGMNYYYIQEYNEALNYFKKALTLLIDDEKSQKNIEKNIQEIKKIKHNNNTISMLPEMVFLLPHEEAIDSKYKGIADKRGLSLPVIVENNVHSRAYLELKRKDLMSELNKTFPRPCGTYISCFGIFNPKRQQLRDKISVLERQDNNSLVINRL